MTAVDPAYAIGLKNEALYLRALSPASSWGARGVSSKAISPLAQRNACEVEAVRQAAFLGGPTVRDRAVVPGARRDLIGRTITLRFAGLGYSGGVACFVIGADEGESETVLTVLRRLQP